MTGIAAVAKKAMRVVEILIGVFSLLYVFSVIAINTTIYSSFEMEIVYIVSGDLVVVLLGMLVHLNSHSH